MYLFSEGLIIARNCAFQNGLRLTIKKSLKDYKNSLKQLALTDYELIFGKAYYRKDFCI